MYFLMDAESDNHKLMQKEQEWYTFSIVNTVKARSIYFNVKFLNFPTLEKIAVIYLKFKQRDQTLGYFIKKMKME